MRRSAGRRPRPRSSRRGARRSRAPCRRTRRADGTRRAASRPPAPARGPPRRARRRCGPAPGRRTGEAHRPAARSRRRGRRGSRARPRRGSPAPRRSRVRRARGSGTAPGAPASRDATAATGQPARWSAAQRRPTAPAPTIPMSGGSPPPSAVGVRVPGSPSRRGRAGQARRVEVDPALPELLERRASGARAAMLGRSRRRATPSPAVPGRCGADSRYDSTRRVYPAPRSASVPRPDPFGARASLGAGLPDYWRLGALGDRSTSSARPSRSRSCSRTRCATRAAGSSTRATCETLASWRPGLDDRGRGPVHALARPAPGLHRRARDRRPRRDARRDGRPRRRSRARESARPGGPRHRPLGPGRPVRDAGRVRVQRRARVRAQRRALPAAALGPDRVPRPARRPAGHGHRPPGQPRVPRLGRHRPRPSTGPEWPSRTPSSAPTRTRR